MTCFHRSVGFTSESEGALLSSICQEMMLELYVKTELMFHNYLTLRV